MRLLLIPITSERWKSPDMALAVEQARDSARRIQKKVDIRRERTRFSIACEQIETIAMQQNRDRHFVIEGEQAYKIMRLFPAEGKAHFPFLGPSEVQKVKSDLPPELSVKVGITGGLVAILIPFRNIYIPQKSLTSDQKKIKFGAQKPDYSLCNVDLSTETNGNTLHRTHKQIRKAIETGECLGWVRHEFFTKAIREYIGLKERPTTTKTVKVKKDVPDVDAIAQRESKWWFKFLKSYFPIFLPKSIPMKSILVDKERIVYLPIKPVYIRIAFRDGSEGAPFPLFCLPPIKEPRGLPVIRAALMSGRHFDLDSEVDICLLRNSELKGQEDVTIAKQEEIAYNRVTDFIYSCLEKMDGIELHIYHTGLEPTVVGTYRAIVEVLRTEKYRGKFMVIPRFYRGNRFVDEKAWY